MLLGVPLVIYVMSRIDLTQMPKDQIGSTITTTIHGNAAVVRQNPVQVFARNNSSVHQFTR